MAKAADTIQDIVESLKERFTNPLVFAFMASWVVCNWHAVVALLWTDSGSRIRVSEEIINYIDAEVTWRTGILYPLVSAIVLVLLLPTLKVLLQGFNAWLNKQGTSWVLSIKKEGSIPVRKYLALRDRYDKNTAHLIKLIEIEEPTIQESEKLKSDIVQLRASNVEWQKLNSNLSEQLAVMQREAVQAFDVTTINGTWQFEQVAKYNMHETEILEINDGHGYLIKHTGNGTFERNHQFRIIGFSMNKSKNQVYFTKQMIFNSAQILMDESDIKANVLRIVDNGKYMIGDESGNAQVKYTRIEPPYNTSLT